MSVQTADVVVVGLGAVGAATLLALARSGVRAIGVDRFDPPHDQGSTHGESRITRLAVAEGGDYVPLARRSHAIWRELEAETGESLFVQCGMLIIGEGDGAPSHGQAGFLGSSIAVAEAHGVPHEVLDAGEIRRRWPQFQVRDVERGFHEPSAGMVFPERAVAVQLRLARARGAVVRPNETVLAVEPRAGGVTVTTANGRIDAARAVLTAGAWMPGLVPGLAPVALVQRQMLAWFEAEEPALYEPARCPVFIWMHGMRVGDYLYGFPTPAGARGVKTGTEEYGVGIDPDQVDRAVPEAEWRGLYARHVAGRLRGITDRMLRAATCLYTVTPDAGFVVDRLPGSDGAIVVASPCSGHGFKHSAALGERLARIASGVEPLEESFGMGRFRRDAA